ncbi:MAG: replication protein [Endomicrobium sp.]|jgi:phage replication O-like protein O|nr:replication protein [Endomicrobium sp.]
MSNPQIENGYLKIANDLYEAVYLFNFTRNEMKIVSYVIRQTYGFNRKSVPLKQSKIMADLKLAKGRVSVAFNNLIRMNVLIHEKGTGKTGINKDYDSWKEFSKRESESSQNENKEFSKRESEVNEMRTSTLYIAVKDNIKDNSKEGIPLMAPKDFFTKWNEFAKINNLSSVSKLTTSRKDKLSARLKEKEFNFDNILTAIVKQPFLLGQNNRKWKVDFDWIIKNDNNYTKILEEKYLNSTTEISSGAKETESTETLDSVIQEKRKLTGLDWTDSKGNRHDGVLHNSEDYKETERLFNEKEVPKIEASYNARNNDLTKKRGNNG